MTPKVKICGITNPADAALAVELGADMLGFNFYPVSRRYVRPETAATIIKNLQVNANAEMVGLFVNSEPEHIAEVLKNCPITIAQLHGDETDDQCRAVADMGVMVIKAIRVRKPDDIEAARQYNTDFILLDTFDEKLYGGSGRKFDWSWVGSIHGRKILLAGGINPENVRQAMAVGTYGIDLCSGIEKTAGIKDHNKMKLLFEQIRAAANDD